MRQTFDPERRLVLVRAEFCGPSGAGGVRLALDTGATRTLVSLAFLATLGLDLARPAERVSVTTGSGVESVPILSVLKLTALGKTCRNFPILGHNLPPSATVEGLLGLDFLRGGRLEIDFQSGFVQLDA